MSKYLIFAHGDAPNGGINDLYDISDDYCEAEDLATTSIELVDGPDRYAYVWDVERNDVVFNIALLAPENKSVTTSTGYTDINFESVDDDWDYFDYEDEDEEDDWDE